MKIKIIGDIHGKFDAYKKVIADAEYSIQIGDFGFDMHWSKLARHKIDPDRHRIIPGNHDDYEYIANSARAKEWTFGKDYGMQNFKGLDFFFVRGAWSIDKSYRTPEYDWWEAEEISADDLDLAIEEFCDVKPDIMITHECPGATFDGISQVIFGVMWRPNRTSQALQRMWDVHKPKLWFFGHWHKTGFWSIRNTDFVCLGELDSVDYEIDENLGNDVDWNVIQIREQVGKPLWRNYE